MRNILVIIPTYNERPNIEKICSTTLDARGDLDLLIVDDNSPDGTGKAADDIAGKNNRVSVLHRPRKIGMGKAYIDGFNWGLEKNYEYILEMDADFSHNPSDLERLLKEMPNCDLCIGSRYIDDAGVVNWPIWREILSRAANYYVRAITGMPIYDTTAGFKCFRRNVLESINLDAIHSEGYSFQIEMHYRAWKKKFRIKEIPIIFKDRSHGHSKMSKKIIAEAFFIVWKLILEKNANK